MKTSRKFIAAFIAVALVFSALTGVVSALCLNKIKETSNNTVLQVIAEVKENYPNVSEIELARILNGRSKTDDAQKLLESYGITSDDWAVYENKSQAATVVAISCYICLALAAALLVVFALYLINENKKVRELTGYLTRLNMGDYDLKINKNSEEQLSLLENEIYKTTVMLREQSENSQKDKENLKQSLSDISHQLKTPLTSIIVLIENMIDDSDMPQDIRLDFLEDIRHSTSTISFLVQSLLTLSKLDANSIVLRRKQESVGKIFEECVKNTAVLAEIKEVAVKIDCDEDVNIMCDFKWLCEAITNILKNCVEHTKQGGQVVLAAEENSLYTKITVTDNGCGIAPDDLPHIFERFYKGRNSDENSVGIGLALAKTIVEKNGGYITVKSELYKGSTFTIKYFKNNLN